MELKQVEQFVYLGGILWMHPDSSDSTEEDVSRKVGLTRGIFQFGTSVDIQGINQSDQDVGL